MYLYENFVRCFNGICEIIFVKKNLQYLVFLDIDGAV